MRRHSKNTFLRVSPTKWRRKPADDMEQNYVTVTLCIQTQQKTSEPISNQMFYRIHAKVYLSSLSLQLQLFRGPRRAICRLFQVFVWT